MANELKIKKLEEGTGFVYKILGENHGGPGLDTIYERDFELDAAIAKAKVIIDKMPSLMVESEGPVGADYVIKYKAKPTDGAGKPSYGHEGLEATNKRFNRNIRN